MVTELFGKEKQKNIAFKNYLKSLTMIERYNVLTLKDIIADKPLSNIDKKLQNIIDTIEIDLPIKYNWNKEEIILFDPVSDIIKTVNYKNLDKKIKILNELSKNKNISFSHKEVSESLNENINRIIYEALKNNYDELFEKLLDVKIKYSKLPSSKDFMVKLYKTKLQKDNKKTSKKKKNHLRVVK